MMLEGALWPSIMIRFGAAVKVNVMGHSCE